MRWTGSELREGARGMPWPLAAVLLVAACTGSDPQSAASCAHGVTQDLDAGRFDAALDRLDSRACAAQMTREQLEINRSAAYVGKAGYDVADLLLAVLDAEDDASSASADERLLEVLTGLGNPGGLRHLARANAAYQRMMDAFAAGLDEACDDSNVHLLSELQRDACFHSGLLAYARFARGFDLLLNGELAAFLGLRALDCNNDRNFSGTADEAEITACAIQARTRLDEGGGVCLEPGMHENQPRGAVTWERIAGIETVPFFEDGIHFANVVPIRVRTEAGGTCQGARTDLRMLQPRAAAADALVTGGTCESEITRSCAASDAEAGCWPCPIPRLSGDGAITLAETVLDAVNFQAERIMAVLTDDERVEMREELDEMREELCAEVAGTPQACVTDASGTQVNRDAIREYLRK